MKSQDHIQGVNPGWFVGAWWSKGVHVPLSFTHMLIFTYSITTLSLPQLFGSVMFVVALAGLNALTRREDIHCWVLLHVEPLLQVTTWLLNSFLFFFFPLSSVSVLIFNTTSHCFILVKQFRPGNALQFYMLESLILTEFRSCFLHTNLTNVWFFYAHEIFGRL